VGQQRHLPPPGEIIPERWATSSRNGGRDHPGILGGFLPESAIWTPPPRNRRQHRTSIKSGSTIAPRKSGHRQPGLGCWWQVPARRGQRRVGALILCLNQAAPCPSNAGAKARHGGRPRNDRKATRSGKHRGRHRCGARSRCAKAGISRGGGRLELCSQPHESGARWWMCPR
jgi:hypothetical protein